MGKQLAILGEFVVTPVGDILNSYATAPLQSTHSLSRKDIKGRENMYRGTIRLAQGGYWNETED